MKKARWVAPELASLDSGFEAQGQKKIVDEEGPGDSGDPGVGDPFLDAEDLGPS